MGVPSSEVGYTPAMPRREDHEVHKDMWWLLEGVGGILSLRRIKMSAYAITVICTFVRPCVPFPNFNIWHALPAFAKLGMNVTIHHGRLKKCGISNFLHLAIPTWRTRPLLSKFEWYPCCRLQHATRIPLQPNHTETPTHIEPRTTRPMW